MATRRSARDTAIRARSNAPSSARRRPVSPVIAARSGRIITNGSHDRAGDSGRLLGLRPLEADDAGIFFGRDAAIVEALDTLRGLRDAAAPRLLVILGASGAGKSSFLRAGLFPRIARDDQTFLGQNEAHPFLALLRHLLNEDTPAVIAVFTIRSDNYERLQLAKDLEDVRQQTLSLPPMPKGSYADVIKGPARRLDGTARALKIEDALVDALLADIEAGGAKDALPLLAFTLERLYGEYHAGGHLKLSHYNDLGR